MIFSNLDSAFVPDPKCIYKIIPVYAQNLAFEIKDGKTEDKTNVQLGELSEVPYQYFKILEVKDSKCIIKPVHCTDKVIDIDGNKMKIRANIYIFTKNLNSDKQLFRIVKAGDDDNTYSILSSIDENYCLDVHARGKKKGANIQLFKRNNTVAQIFKIIKKKDIFASIDYALKYSTERNPEYKALELNCANFCSQCLLAGGIEEDNNWKKDSESFTDPTKLRQHFYDKGIEWSEFPGAKDINPGDIAYMQNAGKFDHPIFVVRKDNDQIIFCGNNMDIREGSLNYNLIGAVLKTSSFFK